MLRYRGGVPGMNGDLEICLGLGYVIAVPANMDRPPQGGACQISSPTACLSIEPAQSTEVRG